jgi:hypothetical protein
VADRRGRRSSRGDEANLRSGVVQYIGPPADSQHLVEAAREEGLEAEYSPLISARRGDEIFEVGEVRITGPDLRARAAKAMNRVLQQFPVGHISFRGFNPAGNSYQHEVDLHAFMRVLPVSARIVLRSGSDQSRDTGPA